MFFLMEKKKEYLLEILMVSCCVSFVNTAHCTLSSPPTLSAPPTRECGETCGVCKRAVVVGEQNEPRD